MLVRPLKETGDGRSSRSNCEISPLKLLEQRRRASHRRMPPCPGKGGQPPETERPDPPAPTPRLSNREEKGKNLGGESNGGPCVGVCGRAKGPSDSEDGLGETFEKNERRTVMMKGTVVNGGSGRCCSENGGET